MSEKEDDTLKVLKEIVLGGVVSEERAGLLVSSILSEFPDADDDERFEELLHILACYNPLGGEYLYDSAALKEEARRVLSLLSNQQE
jgi:hypothetical protein